MLTLEQSSLCYTQSPLLGVHFKDSCLYMSIPNSSYPLPLSFPLATISLFSVCESLFCKQVHLYNVSLESTYKGCHLIFLLL